MKFLLIPSAHLIPESMRTQFGEIPSALFPLENTTVLEYLYNQFHEDVEEIYVVAQAKKILIEDYIRWKKLPIRVVSTSGHSLSDSISDGIHAIIADHPGADEVIINFGDTYLKDICAKSIPEDSLFYALTPLSNAWTFVEEENGILVSVTDKKQIPTTEKTTLGKVAVGVFSISDCKLLLQCIFSAQKDSNKRINSFYKALMQYSENHALSFIETNGWVDTGHIENYYQAKTGVATRVFNSIEVDQNKGTMIKRSQNVDKFLDEIRWYLKIPSSLQYLLPRIYDYSLDRDNPYVEMEYYGYHTLHEMLIYSDLPLIKWQKLMEKLRYVINDMSRFTVTASDNTLIQAMRDIYISKTINRLEELRKQKEFHSFFEEPITVNQEQYPSLNDIIEILPSLLEKSVLNTFDGNFTIIHGDLCFANILVEDKYNYMRLIDPRGKFGKFDIYGDPRYDLAKLMHTLEGKYDYIIEDMFEIKRTGNNLDYRLPPKSNHIFDLFCEVFKDKITDINAVRMIEATLFLSMIPLHSDYLNRQYAMLATGLTLLKEAMQND